ncbi:hypothetical protein Hanom_Chr13g01232231 [Helianthus anomalus]
MKRHQSSMDKKMDFRRSRRTRDTHGWGPRVSKYIIYYQKRAKENHMGKLICVAINVRLSNGRP